jgi:hypothetical protein
MKIYVASSWRNEKQPGVVQALREAGYEVYDFKEPIAGNVGFGWKEVDPDWQRWSVEEYKKALEHPLALAGYKSDWSAMRGADMCVLVLPCGRSAHLEAGYFVGAKKVLLILVEDAQEPELMYKMADKVCGSLHEVLTFCALNKHWIINGK